LKIDEKKLLAKCDDISSTNGMFGLAITNPQNGRMMFIYNKNIMADNSYSPGSLLKMFALIACQEKKRIDMGEKHDCPGYVNEDDKICWLKKGHGELDLVGGISNSCNYYFYKFVENKLSPEIYFSVLNDYKISGITSVANLSTNDFYLTSIGLGTVIQSRPMDVLYAYNALFNDGKIFNMNGEYSGSVKQSSYVNDIIRMGMKSCYLHGTAKSIFEKTNMPDIIAKTGTGIILRNGKEDFNRNIGWVVILSPSINPTFSMLVIVENSRSSLSCDISGEIINFILKGGK
jgi:cell division protein FtsI/penicillin-binding protein 2